MRAVGSLLGALLVWAVIAVILAVWFGKAIRVGRTATALTDRPRGGNVERGAA